MNEGHAGFLGLERIGSLIAEQRADLLRGAVRGAGRHRVHHAHPGAGGHRPLPGRPGAALPGRRRRRDVPVAARPRSSTRSSRWAPRTTPAGSTWRTWGCGSAQRANGVAKLHGSVSRNMFAPLYPGFEPDEVPIGSVTNGVHLPTWAAREMYDVAGDMADWQDLASASEWPAADKVSAERLWELRQDAAAAAGRDGQGHGPQLAPAARRHRGGAGLDRDASWTRTS